MNRHNASLFFHEIADCAKVLPPKLPITSWYGHIPFMYLMVKFLEPEFVVELGVQYGGSLIAACDAVKREAINCRVVGVDTWLGDAHSGSYDGEAAYAELSYYIAEKLSVGDLSRATFDEARAEVSVDSIDLLHIDGLHTYEAVKHDFEAWLPTLTNRAVVLFHDTEVREKGFGVHEFWKEIKLKFRAFEFYHCHGLGVLFVGNSFPKRMEKLIALLENNFEFECFFRSLYETMGNSLPERFRALEDQRRIEDLG